MTTQTENSPANSIIDEMFKWQRANPSKFKDGENLTNPELFRKFIRENPKYMEMIKSFSHLDVTKLKILLKN